MSLASAITDVKEALKTSDLTDSLIKEIAEDYGINPLLLKRKLEENNITAESVRKFNEATSMQKFEEIFSGKFDEAFVKACNHFGVPLHGPHGEYIYKGNRMKLICRNSKGSKFWFMNRSDNQVWWLNSIAFNSAKRVEKENA